MGKLYIFGIGGTGTRVVRSLIMLMASGLKLDVQSVVPILIDSDRSNGDLKRTVLLLKEYEKIQKQISKKDNSVFFNTRVEDVIGGYVLPLDKSTQNLSFKQYIGLGAFENEMDAQGYNSKMNANQALASVLFSQKNLESDMKIGFKGNPNIGSVVLNQFSDSLEFKKFANSFNEKDSIIIINSIFGGTGASGFPLLLKLLRELDDTEFSKSKIIKNALIGSVTVLPYYEIEQCDTSEIDSTTFVAKSKAALKYYNDNIVGNKSINSLYYINDTYTTGTMYPNCEGDEGQKNTAHYIEMLSALAIKDFVTDVNKELKTATNERTNKYVFKEFGLNSSENAGTLTFENFYEKTAKLLQSNLTNFYLLYLYLNNRQRNIKTIAWMKKLNFDKSYLNSEFVKRLHTFLSAYVDWLKELQKNNRSFSPFNLNNKSGDLFDFVSGNMKPVKNTKLESFRGVKNYHLIDHYLNANTKKVSKSQEEEQRFMDLFDKVIPKITKLKYKY